MNKTMAAALFAAFTYSASAASADVAPDVLARSVTDEVMTIVRADKDVRSGNRQKVNQLVESKVLPHFDFSRMTQLAMGKSWRDATPEQQKALTDEFRTLLVRTYATAFTQYRDQNIEYQRVRMAPTDTDVVVKSLIKQPAGQPVAIDYNMEKLAGTWKVYDVKIEGVSLVENYRNTFNGQVQKSGISGLITALNEKNRSAAEQAKR